VDTIQVQKRDKERIQSTFVTVKEGFMAISKVAKTAPSSHFTPGTTSTGASNNSPIEKLRLSLTSPRKRTDISIESYISIAKKFLGWLGPHVPPPSEAYRSFFEHRRESGVSERTLNKEFFYLKKLADANDWPFPFKKGEAPVADTDASQPVFTREEVEKMILGQSLLSRQQRFYLIVSTIWGCRVGELASIKKIHYNQETITLYIEKHKQIFKKQHLIPNIFIPAFEDYHPVEMSTDALGTMFHNICDKTEVNAPKGHSWHSIRRTLDTLLGWSLLENRLDKGWATDFMGWAKASSGARSGAGGMQAFYDHSGQVSKDPWYQENQILAVHPFVPVWRDSLKKNPVIGNAQTVKTLTQRTKTSA
jgi:integrase